MAVDVDNTQVKKLGYVVFVINSLVNASNSKALFELVYRTNVYMVVDQLDGVHHAQNAQQLATHIEKLIAEARE